MDFFRRKFFFSILMATFVLFLFLPKISNAQGEDYGSDAVSNFSEITTNNRAYASNIISSGNATVDKLRQQVSSYGPVSQDTTRDLDELQALYGKYAKAYTDIYNEYDVNGNNIDGSPVYPGKYGLPRSGFLGLYYTADDYKKAQQMDYAAALDNLNLSREAIKAQTIVIDKKYLGGKVYDANFDAVDKNLGTLAKSFSDRSQEISDNINAAPVVCLTWNKGLDLTGCAALVSWSMLRLSSYALQLTAMVFNISIDYTLNFKNFIANNAQNGGFSIVTLGWTSFRDVTNLFFIFILLYIGIGTIINSGTYNAKKLLVNTLVCAVLINFSLFFTQAMIDVSNVFSLQFYNKITEGAKKALVQNAGNGQTATQSNSSDTDNGISAGIANALGLQDLWTYGSKSANGVDGPPPKLDSISLLLYGVGGSLFLLLTAFVFGAAAYMFVYRAITLLFLMILSPLAFAGGLLPVTQKYASEWWSKLTSNLLFAPVYMGLLYVVLSVVFSQAQTANHTSFLTVFKGSGSGADIALKFFVLIGLMWGCLVVATKIGASGASAASGLGSKWGKALGDRTLGAGARTVIGGAGSVVANSSMLRSLASTPIGGLIGSRALQRGADNLSKKKFGSGSFADSQKASEDKFNRNIELSERVSPSRRGLFESQEDYKERLDTAKKAAKVRGDKVAGISVDPKTGKVTVGKSGPLSSSGYIKTQAARAKSRSKGAEGKVEDRMREIQHMLGESADGKAIYRKDKDGNDTDQNTWGEVKNARVDAEGKIAQAKSELQTAEDTMRNYNAATNPQDKIATAAEIGVLRERKKELEAAITLGKSLEDKLKQLSAEKDQIK